MKSPLKNLNILIKVAISVCILLAIFLHLDHEQQNIARNIAERFEFTAWAYAIVLLSLQFILLSFRWEMLINIGKSTIDLGTAIKINLTSQLANLIFVTSLGGMLARIALSVQNGSSLFKALIATVFDRIMTLVALITLAAIFMPGLSKHVDNEAFAILSGYTSVLVITALLFLPLFINYVVLRMPAMSRQKGKIRYGIRYLKILMNKPLLMGKITLISIAAQMGLFLAAYSLALSSGANISFIDLMTVMPVISLIASIPLSIGGWGVREGAFIYGLGLLGVPMHTAFFISVEIGIIGMIVTIMMGAPALLLSDLKVSGPLNIRQKLAYVTSKKNLK